jgi:PilZ domain
MTCQLQLLNSLSRSEATVQDISSTGVCLVAQQPWEPGNSLDLLMINSTCTCALKIRLEVMRCHPLINGDFYVGGRFSRTLGPLEIRPFLL